MCKKKDYNKIIIPQDDTILGKQLRFENIYKIELVFENKFILIFKLINSPILIKTLVKKSILRALRKMQYIMSRISSYN